MDTFDAVLDEFYSKIESQRVEQQQRVKEESAVQKLKKIQLDQVNMLFLFSAYNILFHQTRAVDPIRKFVLITWHSFVFSVYGFFVQS